MNETTAEQAKSSKGIQGGKWDHLAPYQFKPGQSGNPAGKAKGTVSLKEYAKKYLAEMTDEEKEEFMAGLNKDTVWKMAEGNPKQDLGGDLDLNINRVIRLDE